MAKALLLEPDSLQEADVLLVTNFAEGAPAAGKVAFLPGEPGVEPLWIFPMLSSFPPNVAMR